jgi:hypothetical protein
VFEGGTSDEALEALIAAQPVSDPQRAAVLTDPADGASIAAAPPATFGWKVGAGAMSERPTIEPARRRALEPVLARALGWLLGERPAHAHGPPFSGTGHFVVFSTDADAKLVRVFTSATSYTPATDLWQKMTAQKGPIRVVITTGTFDNNLLAADGGPFVGAARSFSINP